MYLSPFSVFRERASSSPGFWEGTLFREGESPPGRHSLKLTKVKCMGRVGDRQTWVEADPTRERAMKGRGKDLQRRACLWRAALASLRLSGEEWSVVVPTHCLYRAEDNVTSPSWRNTQFQWQGQRQEFSKSCPTSLSYTTSGRSPAVSPRVFKEASCHHPRAPAPHLVPSKL